MGYHRAMSPPASLEATVEEGRRFDRIDGGPDPARPR
jgi:hypothetical protein